MKDTGVPVAGVEVGLFFEGEDPRFPGTKRSESLLDGTFAFDDVDPELDFMLGTGRPHRYKYKHIRTDTHMANPKTGKVERKPRQNYFKIEVEEVGAVTGHVLLSDGTPVPGAWIQRSYLFGNTTSNLTRSDENGRYGFSHDGGTWRFKARGSLGMDSDTIVMDLIPREIREHDLVVPASSSIHLDITKPDGLPPESIGRVIVSIEDYSYISSTGKQLFQQNESVFTISLLTAGIYTIELQVMGFEKVKMDPITIEDSLEEKYAKVVLKPLETATKGPEKSRDVSAPPEIPELATVTFNIQDSQGNPLEMAAFVYGLDDALSVHGGLRSEYPHSRSFPLGTYWFFAVREGLTADIQYWEITEETHEITFVLGEAGTIFGNIYKESGAAMQVLPWEVWKLMGEPRGLAQSNRNLRWIGEALAQGVQADPHQQGAFTLNHLPKGWYVVMSWDIASEPIEVIPGMETGPIILGDAVPEIKK